MILVHFIICWIDRCTRHIHRRSSAFSDTGKSMSRQELVAGHGQLSSPSLSLLIPPQLFLLFSLMFESKVVQLVIIEVLEGEA